MASLSLYHVHFTSLLSYFGFQQLLIHFGTGHAVIRAYVFSDRNFLILAKTSEKPLSQLLGTYSHSAEKVAKSSNVMIMEFLMGKSNHTVTILGNQHSA